ncbi:putative telomerase Cajal body protein 1 [Monocercomonoides exilis]|uniref:putative telomerase Cajal body protein 1 n=1 Tax=Monocercomonoides exilis TaxID=2049356 RepID=UPI00355AA130|nr:putative telomerase Cajal body protein 1 [Monocercomonoides exilis]|eukprot:MONOS_6267.1-p1 / transcript=MONOS_6267.1 / gene=MONOS_6267 / organism=Monocercomonoides_exilis_PA203 / gene_product=telomerase Cajal body protein 1 / transcript_product=telomerase Cajal body protein 1 / location=Mono_scaffold00195:35171-37782(+) / protein_length=717 / sequence_SO=supercontig / SO=protein_coding / is_pseudo=false
MSFCRIAAAHPIDEESSEHRISDFPDEGSHYKGVSFSPDGLCLLSYSGNKKIYIYNVPSQNFISKASNEEWKPVFTINEAETIHDVCWYPYMSSMYPETSFFISVSSQMPIHAWDAFTGKLLSTYSAFGPTEEPLTLYSLDFSIDGTKIYSGGSSLIQLWDVNRSGRSIISSSTFSKKDQSGLKGPITSIDVNPQDQNMLGCGCADGKVGIFVSEGGWSGTMLCGSHTTMGNVKGLREEDAENALGDDYSAEGSCSSSSSKSSSGIGDGSKLADVEEVKRKQMGNEASFYDMSYMSDEKIEADSKEKEEKEQEAAAGENETVSINNSSSIEEEKGQKESTAQTEVASEAAPETEATAESKAVSMTVNTNDIQLSYPSELPHYLTPFAPFPAEMLESSRFMKNSFKKGKGINGNIWCDLILEGHFKKHKKLLTKTFSHSPVDNSSPLQNSNIVPQPLQASSIASSSSSSSSVSLFSPSPETLQSSSSALQQLASSSVPPQPRPRRRCGVTKVQFSPLGNTLVSGARRNELLCCWDIRNTGKRLFTMKRECHTNQRVGFDFTRDGKYVVSGGQNGKVSFFDAVNDGKCVLEIQQEDSVNDVSVHPTLPLLATTTGQHRFGIPFLEKLKLEENATKANEMAEVKQAVVEEYEAGAASASSQIEIDPQSSSASSSSSSSSSSSVSYIPPYKRPVVKRGYFPPASKSMLSIFSVQMLERQHS